VVQWALDAGLYVMINIHHDSWFWLGRSHNENPMGRGWDGNVSSAEYRRFTDYWKQLSAYFADMPPQVCFETINEPEYNVNEQHGTTAAENMRRHQAINKAAFDIIRATPGNENRMVVIPTYKTNHEDHNSGPESLFIRSLNDRNVIATVHYYGEWVFSNHLGRTIFDEPLFGDARTMRSRVDDFYDTLYEQFLSHGIGVSVGEWGLLTYDHQHGATALQRGEELKYYEYMQHRARDFRGVSLSFWDNGSGINRRSADLGWQIPRMGAMLGSKVRSSYSSGLDTLYFRNAPTADVRIPLTLNGNRFVGVEGLTEGTDYTYAGGILTLTRSFVSGRYNAMAANSYGTFAALVLQFSGGLDWHMFLVKCTNATAIAGSGTRTQTDARINFNGHRVHRVSAFRGAAPAVLVENEGQRVGGNHTSWWSYLEYGNAYVIDYATSTLTLRQSFFAGGQQGGGTGGDGTVTVVLEFYDGSRLDVTLQISGQTVTVAGTTGTPNNPACVTCNATPCICPPVNTLATTTGGTPSSTTSPASTTSPTATTTTVTTTTGVTTTGTSTGTEPTTTVTTTGTEPTTTVTTTGTEPTTTVTTTGTEPTTTVTTTGTEPTTTVTTTVTTGSTESTTTTTVTTTGVTGGSPTSPTSTTTTETTTVTTVTTGGTTISSSQATTIVPPLLGDVDDNGIVTIMDALEILKFLAGLTSLVDEGGRYLENSLITPESREARKPSIMDALEILKHLASLPSLIDD